MWNPVAVWREMLELRGDQHQRYHLLRMRRATGMDVRDLDRIVEIGGGYGGMCCEAFDAGFTGTYVIYDFPEMHMLQREYLKKRGCAGHVIYTTDDGDVTPGVARNTLLIGLWSVSEMPMETRRKVMAMHDLFTYRLFAFQERFGGVDNREYFASLAAGGAVEINHLHGNFYIFGNK
jgi:hypothetical protein